MTHEEYKKAETLVRKLNAEALAKFDQEVTRRTAEYERKLLGLDRPLTAEDEKLISDMLA